MLQHLKDGGRKIRQSRPVSATRMFKATLSYLRPCFKEGNGVENRNNNEWCFFKPENTTNLSQKLLARGIY